MSARVEVWFTPTRVGKTPCGGRCRRSSAGSPPRVWGKQRPELREHLRRLVHPHACGENGITSRLVLEHTGSPPRVWGKQGRTLLDPEELRFTPTRVGKTVCGWNAVAAVAVHPHACGENERKPRSWSFVVGSPPRVWGKRSTKGRNTSKRRFTPTRVGKTGACSRRGGCTAVHPHACGENFRALARPSPAGRFTPTRVGKTNYPLGLNDYSGGSPPRVWGKRMVDHRLHR